MTGLSLEVGAGPAKASISTAHLGKACKHTRGLSTCIVVYLFILVLGQNLIYLYPLEN
jgi:hypothetical protein